MMTWFDAHPERQISDAAKDKTMDRLVAAYRSAEPGTASTPI
jgi:hypothetical protein